MVSKRRHNLSDKSIRKATVLSSWSTIPGLVPENDIIKHFNSKHKRPNAGRPSKLQHCEEEEESLDDPAVDEVSDDDE